MDPVDDPGNYKFDVFYFNKEDARVFVPKRMRSFGYTVNFARFETYIFFLCLLLIGVFMALL